MKDLLAGNMSQEQHTKREGTTIVSLGQNVNHDLSEILVTRGTIPEQEETIHDLKEQKDLSGLIETTVGPHLTIRIVQNVQKDHREEMMHSHQAGEMPLHLVETRLQLQQLPVSILNEQHSFKVPRNLVLECQSAGKLKNATVLPDQPLQDVKTIANMHQGLKEKIDRKENLNHKVEMRPRPQQQSHQETHQLQVRHEIAVVLQ